MPAAVELAPITTLLSAISPLPSATKTPSLTAGEATEPICISSPPAGTVRLPSFSISDCTTSTPGTVTAPGFSNRCGPAPLMSTPTVPVTVRLPAFRSVPLPMSPRLPPDHVDVAWLPIVSVRPLWISNGAPRAMLPTSASSAEMAGEPEAMTARSAFVGSPVSQLPGSCQFVSTAPVHVLVSAEALAAKPSVMTIAVSSATTLSHPCNTRAILSATRPTRQLNVGVTNRQFVTLRSIWNDRGQEGATESTQGSRGTVVEPARAAGPILAVRNLEVVYQDVMLVLRGVSLELPRGEIVALLGANGAGKTTLLRAVTGLLGVHRGRVTKGSVELDGRRISGGDAASIVRRGVAQVMEGRRIFAELTVDENLRAGGFTRSRADVREAQERVFELFPVLAERRRSTAGYLSGGEQQMLAIGRALMADPKVLLLDEPSLGLAPRLVEQVRDTIVELNRRGVSVLLVEQNAAMALAIANHGYVMETGRVVKDGPAADLLADQDIQEFYLGVGETGRRSFRDVKSYRRRKRWSG